jgi:hypothetical protein
MYRQGDVLLVPVAAAKLERKIDRDAQDRIVLALGEATGHAHAICDAGASLFFGANPDPGRFLQVTNTVALRHEEHAVIRVPPGLYRVAQQREYEPANVMRYVSD